MNHKKLILIAGIRKCGTSTLYDIIKLYPDISIHPTIKESQIFCLNQNDFKREFKKFQSELSKGSILLDGSTLVPYSLNSYKNLLSLEIETKIIFIIRDPRKRFSSAYFHNVKKGMGIEQRSLSSIVSVLMESSLDQAESLKVEMAEIHKANSKGLVSMKNIKFPELDERYKMDFKQCITEAYTQLKYFRESLYSVYIEQFERELGKENCLVVSLEQLKSEPEQILIRIKEFLDIKSSEQIEIPRSNKTRFAVSDKAKILRVLFRKLGFQKLSRKYPFFNRLVIRFRNRLYDEIDNEYPENFKELSRLFEIELNYWKQRNPVIYDYWTKND